MDIVKLRIDLRQALLDGKLLDGAKIEKQIEKILKGKLYIKPDVDLVDICTEEEIQKGYEERKRKYMGKEDETD